MADCHRRILLQKQHAEGLSHHHGAADDSHMLAGQRNVVALQHFHNGLGGTGCKGLRQPHHDTGSIDLCDAVQILLGAERLQHLLLIDLLRQRPHHQDTVDLRIIVNEGKSLLELLVGHILREFIVLRLQTVVDESLLNASLVGKIRRLLSDTHDGQCRKQPVVLTRKGQALLLQLVCDLLST